jgi:hypothetical protein
MSKVKLSTKDLNNMWEAMLAHRSAIRDNTIKYAVKTEIDECAEWENPFRIHLDNYDNSILELRNRLTNNLISSIIYEKAPNLDIDPEFVLDRMVDALTDEETETTVHDKPLVFDAEWISTYIDKTYLAKKSKLCLSQMLTKINHLASDIIFNTKKSVVTLPFYTGKWFKDAHIVSKGTERLMLEFDKLIQNKFYGRDSFDVSPEIFSRYLNDWATTKPYARDIFREIEIDPEYEDLVRSFKIDKNKSQINITFADEQDVQTLKDLMQTNTN